MNIYSIALFFHITGALGLSVSLGLEWTGLRQIQNATPVEQFRSWMGILKSANKLGFPSMLVTVVTGVYMMVAVWGRTPWLVITVGALVLMIVLARAAAPRVKALGQSLGAENDLLLWVSVQTRSAITLGIIFLKIAKPDWVGSLLTIGAAILLGIVSALLMSRRQAQSQVISTD
jgi:hypothetical protein